MNISLILWLWRVILNAPQVDILKYVTSFSRHEYYTGQADFDHDPENLMNIGPADLKLARVSIIKAMKQSELNDCSWFYLWYL